MNPITAFLIFAFDLSGLLLKKANVRQKFVLLGLGKRENVKWPGCSPLSRSSTGLRRPCYA
jgi:hypothetical protein